MKNTMIKSVFPALLLLTMLAGTRCKKDAESVSYLHITFVDGKTDAPIDRVNWSATFFDPVTGTSYTNERQTGPDGKLSLEIKEGIILSSLFAYREGYGSSYNYNYGFNFIPGGATDMKINMYRYDCTIQLELKNSKAVPDSVNVRLGNGLLFSSNGLAFDQFPYGLPFNVNPFETQTYFIPAVSDDPVSFFWSWNAEEWSADLPLKDVKILAENDTLIYTISN